MSAAESTMGHMILRRFLLLPAVAAATMTVLSPSAAFAASASGVDVTSIRIANVHVASGNCKHTPVAADWTTDGYYSVDGIDYEVWKGSHYVEADDLFFTSDYAGGSNSGAGDYYYCPYLDGLGSF